MCRVGPGQLRLMATCAVPPCFFTSNSEATHSIPLPTPKRPSPATDCRSRTTHRLAATPDRLLLFLNVGNIYFLSTPVVYWRWRKDASRGCALRLPCLRLAPAHSSLLAHYPLLLAPILVPETSCCAHDRYTNRSHTG